MAKEDGRRLPPSVVNFLRDLAVAFLLVAVVFAALFAFARTWPPMVVVESESMQHSETESFLGVVDTGDIVVVQNAPQRSDIAPYLQGRASGYATYGAFGDVIVFQDPGGPAGRWIIHRAIVFLKWNGSVPGGAFDIPTLESESLMKGRDWDSSAPTPRGLGPDDFIIIKDVAFTRRVVSEVRIPLGGFFGQLEPANCPRMCEGYVTMGDKNAPGVDPDLVFQDLVLGRARGELPWFGLLKLTFAGNFAWGDARAPANSWTGLTVALILLVAGPIGLDFGLSLLARRRKEARTANPGEPEEDAPSDANGEASEEGDEASAK